MSLVYCLLCSIAYYGGKNIRHEALRIIAICRTWFKISINQICPIWKRVNLKCSKWLENKYTIFIYLFIFKIYYIY